MSDTSLVFNILAKDKASKTFEKLKGAAMVGGAAAGAALMAGVANAIESSKSQALLSAQLGVTGAKAEGIGKAAGALYSRGVAATLEDANAAIKGLWQNGIVDENATSAELDRVGAKVVNLGTVLEEDSARVTSAVSTMLKTGMAKNADEAFDILAAGAQQGVNKSQDLLDTFNEYPTQFRKLGLGGQQAMGLLSQGLKAGARDSDTVADALKEFSIRAIDGSKSTAEAYKALGLDGKLMGANVAKGGDFANEALDVTLDKLRGIKDPVKQSAIAVGLFGTKAEDMGKALFALDPSEAAAGMGKLGGAADKMGQTLEQSAGAKLDSFKRKAQGALVEQLAKAVPYIESTFGYLSRNSAWVTPVAIALGTFATVIGVVAAAMKVWSAIQVVLNLALWTSPITWIVLGIVALVAIIVLIATKTTWFQTAWKASWNAIKIAFSAVVTFLKQAFLIWWQLYTRVMGWILGKALSAWAGIKNGFGAAINWITGKWNGFTGAFGKARDKIVGKLTGMWSGLWTGFKSVVNNIIGAWNNLSFGIPGFSFAGMSFGGLSVGTPNIPYLAKGGVVQRGGMAVVGDAGPELVSLSAGAQVTPLTGRGIGGVYTSRLELVGDREVVAFVRRLIRTHNLLQGA